MKFIKFNIIFLMYLFFISASNAVEMGIVTGGKSGTYIKIGKDIANLVEKKGIKLNVYPSTGSVGNVFDVYRRKGVQLGIVQSDVLSYMNSYTKDSPTKKNVISKTKMVFPLYNEEIHILALTSIKSIEDLEGKKVAIGLKESGTALTSKLIFDDITGINPNKINIGGKDALDKLKKGEIDAMIYVSGYPVKLFSENISNVHFLNIINKDILEIYPASSIPKNTYPFQTETVETVTVKALLISYDYHGKRCENVATLAKLIFDNIETLKKDGHPKWKTVTLDFKMPKWKQYHCVSRILNNKPPLKDCSEEPNQKKRDLCKLRKEMTR